MSVPSSRGRSTPETVTPLATRIGRRAFLFGALAAGGFGAAYGLTKLRARSGPPGMRWIPGGEFVMGSADPRAWGGEQPAHRVRVDGFWMDETEVTNAQFRAFVDATGYVTTAEKPSDWEVMKQSLPPGVPRPPAEELVPGALVFTPTPGPVPLDNPAAWWRFVPGACWKHPTGTGSNIDGCDDHPVVQVSWDDAVAYCAWAGKRLPTEAEWEHAARGGLEEAKFAWGNEPPTDDNPRANIWQGDFPYRNTRQDGWDRTAPVRSYPPNGYGLYDTAGNVWEWCSDWYRANEYAHAALGGPAVNPTGPAASYDPGEPFAAKRVVRGGSFLCHASYCESYRPAARTGTTPDTCSSHRGFRCAKSKE